MEDSTGLDQNKNSRSIRLLSFNIQVGIQTRHFGDYIMASWQHLLPNRKRLENL
ncbi:MAG: EEP domain-containing protein, partial [Gammaproteobacteria bacterium]